MGPDAGWAYVHSDRVRFGDLDPLRHLNNVAFLRFFESARIAFMHSLFPERDPTEPQEFGLVFAECHINYRDSAYLDEQILTRVRPAAVARSSFRVEFEMRAEADARLLAEGYGVLVGYDHGDGNPTPLVEPLVDALRGAGARLTER